MGEKIERLTELGQLSVIGTVAELWDRVNKLVAAHNAQAEGAIGAASAIGPQGKGKDADEVSGR